MKVLRKTIPGRGISESPQVGIHLQCPGDQLKQEGGVARGEVDLAAKDQMASILGALLLRELERVEGFEQRYTRSGCCRENGPRGGRQLREEAVAISRQQKMVAVRGLRTISN